MEEIAKDWITIYGPLGIGWAVACVLGYMLWHLISIERPSGTLVAYQDMLEKYEQLAEKYHDAIVAGTKATERLAILIEERTRRRD